MVIINLQVIVMVAVFCFCWGPYASFAMINISGHGKVDNDVVADIEQNYKNISTKSRICSVIMPISRVAMLPSSELEKLPICNAEPINLQKQEP